MRHVSWKTGNAIAVCVIAIVLGQISAAQEQRKAEPKAPPAPQSTQKPPAADEIVSKPSAITTGPNIRMDITITDQAGSEPPVKKTLSVIAADHGSGSIRSTVTVAVPTYPPGPDAKISSFERLPLNVDVKPEVTRNGQIRVQLILNYETYYFATKSSGIPAVRSVVTANQWVMLENGKPMTVSQSADAATDRKVSIELTATILK